MLCPACRQVSLPMTDRQGIEIDCSLQCRGIWLDPGELDRLIEHTEQCVAQSQKTAPTARDEVYLPQRGEPYLESPKKSECSFWANGSTFDPMRSRELR